MKNKMEGGYKVGIFVTKEQLEKEGIKPETADQIKDQISDIFKESENEGQKIEISERRGSILNIPRNPKYPSLEELDGDNKDDKEVGG